jgi:histidinol dehydrogenase
MLRRRDLRGVQIDSSLVLPRAELDLDDAIDVVRPVVEDVRQRGEAAALDYCERFDGVRPAALRVTAEQIAAAVAALTPEIRAALEEAIRRVRIVHSAQQRVDVTTEVVPGGTVMERWIPVSRVGLYVPGGRAVYPSSVIMNVVPAQIAGVGSIAVVSPPQKDHDGLPHPTILAACSLLGIDEV